MLGRALLVIPLVLLSVSAPGCVVVGRLRWRPLETLAGSVALSLLLLYLLTFAAYWLDVSSARAYPAIAVTTVGLTIAGLPQILALLQSKAVRRTLLIFAALVLWTLGAQALIRHYSGGDWCCDWLEHYQKSLFFLEHWPKDFLFLDRYLVTARPPFMNVVCAYFLGLAGKDFAIFQIVFSLLNLLIFFPCCLLARRFAPRVTRRPELVAAFLAGNPMFFMNTTFTWTKVLAAFYVLFALSMYLAGWKRKDSVRMAAAFLALAAGVVVHFSTAPYALMLTLLYLTTVWRTQGRRLQTLVLVGLPAAVVCAVWLGWSLHEYGAAHTFLSNTSVEGTAARSFGENVERISLVAFHTFRPYVFPGRPEDSPLRLLTDRTFTFYQENFLGGMGLVNAWVAIAFVVGLVSPRRTRLSRPERRFWLVFVVSTLLLGIAANGDPSPSGVANLTLQPLVYLALTLVAARYATLSRTARILVWCGWLADLGLGVALELYMESQMKPWARTPNWDLKIDHHLVFLGDVVTSSASMIVLILAAAAAGTAYWLWRMAWMPVPVRQDRRRTDTRTRAASV